MPTIDDIAQACGTSKATVSKVLNGNDHKISEAKRQEIRSAISRMQYQPSAHARSLSKRRANMIGVVTSQTSTLFNSQYYSALINAILNETTARKQTLALFNGQIWADENRQQLIFADGRCDGLLIINAPSMPELVPTLLRTPMPFVTINSGSGASKATLPFVAINSGLLPENVHAIDIDNVAVGYTATQYLIEQGHHKIAFFHSYSHASFSQERLQGYRRALAEALLPFDESLIFPGEGGFQSGYERARRFIARNNVGVKAIFCAADSVAFGAMQGIIDAGYRIPQDYSVIGVDDTPAATHSKPSLTTVSQSLTLLGTEATRMLLNLIENPAIDTQKVVWTTELKIRESVAPPNT